MYTNKNINYLLFIVNYISSVLFIMFIITFRIYFDFTWADTSFYTTFTNVPTKLFYISILLAIFFISMTIYFYNKIRKIED